MNNDGTAGSHLFWHKPRSDELESRISSPRSFKFDRSHPTSCPMSILSDANTKRIATYLDSSPPTKALVIVSGRWFSKQEAARKDAA